MELRCLAETDSPRWAAARRLLGPDAPTALQTWGDAPILERAPLVALLCSLKCPGELILKTYDLARRLRDEGIAVIGGFHSPMEREALHILLKGQQPLVICLGRSLEGARLPGAYRRPLEEGRLLLLSPFEASQCRLTAQRARERNLLVGALAERILILHAEPGGKVAEACGEFVRWGKPVLAVRHPANEHLATLGVRLEADPLA